MGWFNHPQPPSRHLKPNQEVLELHQSYAKRLQSLRAQHGGERRAFEVAEVGETAAKPCCDLSPMDFWHSFPGGGFKYFLFSTLLGEIIQFD